jgi:hypothetical protein
MEQSDASQIDGVLSFDFVEVGIRLFQNIYGEDKLVSRFNLFFVAKEALPDLVISGKSIFITISLIVSVSRKR